MTGKKNPHVSEYGVKNLSVCPSVRPSVKNFDPNYKHFQISFDFFLVSNIYPDSHHSQGGMKFATQISPILNYKMF